MNFGAVAPLITAMISAIVAAVVAVWTSYYTVQFEMQKLALSAQSNAIQNLIEARLNVYTAPYRIASQFEKDHRAGIVDREYLERMLNDYDKWDSSNAHLLGLNSMNIVAFFRIQLTNSVDYFDQSNYGLASLLNAAMKLELALRSDLGIYGIAIDEDGIAIPVPAHY